jgi:hypothetical protein
LLWSIVLCAVAALFYPHCWSWIEPRIYYVGTSEALIVRKNGMPLETKLRKAHLLAFVSRRQSGNHLIHITILHSAVCTKVIWPFWLCPIHWCIGRYSSHLE